MSLFLIQFADTLNYLTGIGIFLGSALGYMIKTIKTDKQAIAGFNGTKREIILAIREIRDEQIRSREEFTDFRERLAHLEGVERVRKQSAAV